MGYQYLTSDISVNECNQKINLYSTRRLPSWICSEKEEGGSRPQVIQIERHLNDGFQRQSDSYWNRLMSFNYSTAQVPMTRKGGWENSLNMTAAWYFFPLLYTQPSPVYWLLPSVNTLQTQLSSLLKQETILPGFNTAGMLEATPVFTFHSFSPSYFLWLLQNNYIDHPQGRTPVSPKCQSQ